MKHFSSCFGRLILAALLLASLESQGQAPNWRWAVQSVNGFNTAAVVTATAVDAAGDIYVTGTIQGAVAFGSTTLTTGAANAFVAKLDAGGNWLWAVQPTSGLSNFGRSIAIGANGTVYVGGTFQNTVGFGTISLASRGAEDVFVARLSATTGQWLGAARAGGPGIDSCNGLVVLGTDVYVTGAYTTAVAFDNLTTLSSIPDNGAGFVAKLNSDNRWLWATNASGMSAAGLTVSATTGGLYLGGTFSASRPIAFGPVTLSNALGSIVVAHMSPATGQFLGAAQAGGNVSDECQGLATDSQGRVLVTGNFGRSGFGSGTTASFDAITLGAPATTSANQHGDAYVACLDPATLAWQWATAIRCSDEIGAIGLAAGRNGEACVVGYFNGTLGPQALTSTGQGSSFLVRLNATGQILLADRANGTGRTIGYSVAVDNAGEVYLAGGFERTATFGTITLTSAATNNPNPNTIFIAKTGLLLGSRATATAVSLHLFPNPAQGTATLLVPAGFPASGRSIILYNGLGQVVRQPTMPVTNPTRVELDLTGLASGSYSVQLRAGQEAVIKRLVIE